MKLFRIRVVHDVDGRPITAGQASLRLLGYWINSIAFYIGSRGSSSTSDGAADMT